MSDDLVDVDLFLAAALALEARANLIAFGKPAAPSKVDLVC
jgi:hypothetical protein